MSLKLLVLRVQLWAVNMLLKMVDEFMLHIISISNQLFDRQYELTDILYPPAADSCPVPPLNKEK